MRKAGKIKGTARLLPLPQGSWARRGRPRTKDSSPDYGTQELQRYRQSIVGESKSIQNLSAFNLGVLLAKGLINKDQYWAGNRYAHDCQAAFRTMETPRLSKIKLSHIFQMEKSYMLSGQDEDDDLAGEIKIKQRWESAVNSLNGLGKEAKSVVDRVAVYEGGLQDCSRQRDKGLKLLTLALDELANHYEGPKSPNVDARMSPKNV